MNSRRKNKFIALVLVVIGIALVAYGFKDGIKSSLLRRGVEEETAHLIRENFDYTREETPVGKNKTTVWKYPTETHIPEINRVENTKEYASIGAFIIPSLGETISIMDGFGGNNMYRGAGVHYVNQEMGVGNYVLSSHRMYNGTLFGRLEDVEVGEDVYITDYETVYKYEVDYSDNRVSTTQTQLLKDTTEPILTFYGCTSDTIMRVVKQAKLVGYSLIDDLGVEDKEMIVNNLDK